MATDQAQSTQLSPREGNGGGVRGGVVTGKLGIEIWRFETVTFLSVMTKPVAPFKLPVTLENNNNDNNNDNVHLSCAHQRPERSHDTY